ncbi:hypothetical protein J5N97_030017 [Dioscorea zingiberensis]|uniref:Uncharacterized protein n=1 Tax=Dioscorea zingiberensis TaxID=325984 RepID=A0A9D5BX19_9LILI|nr:hypothetical protein J5N97_030017 [Dioscorea zingiberensis]
MTKEEEVLFKSMAGISGVYMDTFLTKENLLRCRLIVATGNPMDDDLDLARGILASLENEVHPPLPRVRKKKEVESSKGADTSKEEKKKRRQDVDPPKKKVKGDPVVGSSQERRTKRKNSEDASGPGIMAEQLNSPHQGILPALAPIPEDLSPSRPEDILLRETAQWADRVSNLCQEDLTKMEASRAEVAQLSSRVAVLEEKEKKQLAVIRAHEQDKVERLQQLAAMEKEKNDLAAKLVNSEGSLRAAEGNIKKLQDESSSLKEELKSAQAERAEARWELKLKIVDLTAVQTELEEVKGERGALKEDLASRQKAPKSDSQEMKDLRERADKLEKEVLGLGRE